MFRPWSNGLVFHVASWNSNVDVNMCYTCLGASSTLTLIYLCLSHIYCISLFLHPQILMSLALVDPVDKDYEVVINYVHRIRLSSTPGNLACYKDSTRKVTFEFYDQQEIKQTWKEWFRRGNSVLLQNSSDSQSYVLPSSASQSLTQYNNPYYHIFLNNEIE